MKIKNWILVLCILLTGCSIHPVSEIHTETDSKETPSLTNTDTLTNTPHPTVTQIPSQTPTMVYPATDTPEPKVVHESIEIETEQSLMNLHGRVFLFGRSMTYSHQYPSYIWDFDQNLQIPIKINPDQLIESLRISPDRQKIALIIGSRPINREHLRILDFNGEQLSSEDITEKFYVDIVDWYDEEHILLSTISIQDRCTKPEGLVVYNPFTNESLLELSVSDYPGVPECVPPWLGWQEYQLSLAVYNPGYRFVVYYQLDEKITLRDVLAEKNIVTLDPGWDAGPPRWTSDGESYFIDMYSDREAYLSGIYREEFFQIDETGNVEQLTDLTTFFPEVNIWGFTVSPDDQTIAFWMNTDSNTLFFNLALFEIENDRIRIFDGVIFNVLDTRGPFTTHWSADSTQIMVVTKPNEVDYQALLIDIEKNFAVELPKDLFPVGWLYDDTP